RLRQSLDLLARFEALFIQRTTRLVELLPRALELLAQRVELLLGSRCGPSVEIDAPFDARSLAVELERVCLILRHAESLFVQEAEIDQRPRIPLVRGFLIPERRVRIVGRRAQAFFVDLPHIGLRDLVAALRGREPYL